MNKNIIPIAAIASLSMFTACQKDNKTGTIKLSGGGDVSVTCGDSSEPAKISFPAGVNVDIDAVNKLVSKFCQGGTQTAQANSGQQNTNASVQNNTDWMMPYLFLTMMSPSSSTNVYYGAPYAAPYSTAYAAAPPPPAAAGPRATGTSVDPEAIEAEDLGESAIVEPNKAVVQEIDEAAVDETKWYGVEESNGDTVEDPNGTDVEDPNGTEVQEPKFSVEEPEGTVVENPGDSSSDDESATNPSESSDEFVTSPSKSEDNSSSAESPSSSEDDSAAESSASSSSASEDDDAYVAPSWAVPPVRVAPFVVPFEVAPPVRVAPYTVNRSISFQTLKS